MKAGRALRQARRRAGLTQRDLAGRAGVPQPSIARIESGRVEPRVDTLDRLLRLCGEQLEVVPLLGSGVDRTLIERQLRLTPVQRLDRAAKETKNLKDLVRSRT